MTYATEHASAPDPARVAHHHVLQSEREHRPIFRSRRQLHQRATIIGDGFKDRRTSTASFGLMG